MFKQYAYIIDGHLDPKIVIMFIIGKYFSTFITNVKLLLTKIQLYINGENIEVRKLKRYGIAQDRQNIINMKYKDTMYIIDDHQIELRPILSIKFTPSTSMN